MNKIEKNKFIKGNWYVTKDNNIFKFDKFVKEGNIEYISFSSLCNNQGTVMYHHGDIPINHISKCILVDPKLIATRNYYNPEAKFYGFTDYEYNNIKHAYINNINNFDTYDIF